jgi:DNA-binding transcriptional regulator YiaG
MVLWGFRPRTIAERQQENYRKRKKQHVRHMRQILRDRGVHERDPDRPVITVVQGFIPKDLERSPDGAWRPKTKETDYILGEEGNWLIDPQAQPEAQPQTHTSLQVWQDFRTEVRHMIVEEVQAIMAAGWPFDSQLAKISPHDMLLSQRILQQRIALKISQAALGKLIGVAPRTISDWERARKPIPNTVIPRLKRHLHIEQY